MARSAKAKCRKTSDSEHKLLNLEFHAPSSYLNLLKPTLLKALHIDRNTDFFGTVHKRIKGWADDLLWWLRLNPEGEAPAKEAKLMDASLLSFSACCVVRGLGFRGSGLWVANY